jgi:uridine kinase
MLYGDWKAFQEDQMSHEIGQVIKRSGAVVPFNAERIVNAIYRALVAIGQRDKPLAEQMAAQVVTILAETLPPGRIPSVEEIQDTVEAVLIKNGHVKLAKAYILYRDERARSRAENTGKSHLTWGNIPYRKIWHVLSWAVDHDLNTVERLNARIARGEFAQIIAQTDAAYEEDVTAAAELILERRDDVRVVIIAGPSSSGKTTTTIKLGQRLEQEGLGLVALNVDNYFFDLELHPKDEYGDYDFETPQALDLPLINEHLQRLIEGEEVLIPFYDFKTSSRQLDVTPMRVEPNDMVLIDSLHGLYGPMTEGIADHRKCKLYIETLLQMKGPDGKFIRWTDLRLMRRMLRDAVYRSYDPQRTLEHWHYVRGSELRNIIPYIGTADYIINSGLPYELPIVKPKLFDDFERWAELYRDDPHRHDAFLRAERVYRLLKAVAPVEDDSVVPRDSLLREFIGGSRYEY